MLSRVRQVSESLVFESLQLHVNGYYAIFFLFFFFLRFLSTFDSLRLSGLGCQRNSLGRFFVYAFSKVHGALGDTVYYLVSL